MIPATPKPATSAITRLRKMIPLIGFITALALVVFNAQAESLSGKASFELPALTVVKQEQINGREVRSYEHADMPQWGYQTPQKDEFHLVLPAKPMKAAPLCVVLHSAGGNGREALPAICQPHDRNFYGDETYYVLCLDCAKNKNDWWWGQEENARNPDRYRNELCPTEQRAFATIEWVIRTFGIDRNRVYLNGISMGGSGSLGLGLARGEVFAAVSVVVPAGVKHMEFRTLNRKFPDPPPLFNISSQADTYALGQENLLKFCEDNRYFLAFAWGPFGHTADVSLANLAVYEYPWLSIRKNEAYPAFTHATTDNRYPGYLNTTVPDQNGQINGYFRWQNIEDASRNFEMELRLVTKDELSRPVETPREAIADITPRRLQRFAIGQGTAYQWQVTRAEKVLQSGKVTADASGVLTIPSVTISDTPSRLKIAPDKATGGSVAPAAADKPRSVNKTN